MAKSEGVKAKKHLGQHFLNDENICKRIVESLQLHNNYDKVLEVGPGVGALTKYLVKEEKFTTWVNEIDKESIAYLSDNFSELEGKIINHDFLKLDFNQVFDTNFAIIGNFPYNISSQILFKIYDNRDKVEEVVGMFQKEVAERVVQKPGTKTYGIISVLMQAFYDVEYLFTVSEKVFIPPPKVKSAVIRLKRNKVKTLNCDERFFKTVVKTAFNQRRKTLRNSLKSISKDIDTSNELFNRRPETLSVEEFINLANILSLD